MSYDAQYFREHYKANRDRILARRRAFAKANPERVKAWEANANRRPTDPAKQRLTRQRYDERNPDYLLWNAARQRARRDGLPFSIERSDVVIPESCPLLGIPIRRGNGRMQPNSPSLDRIDNDLGYVPGNVWVISWKANRIKSDATLQELRLLCSKLLKKFRHRKE